MREPRVAGLSYANPRPKKPNRPENPEEILGERIADALDETDDEPHNKEEGDEEDGWVIDDDVCTDGSTVVGFFDASHPQPYDNSRRVWYVDDPHVERQLVKTEDSAVGFYAMNGVSLVRWTETEEKEKICSVIETVREQNPGQRILPVLDKHGSHICEYTRKRGATVALGASRHLKRPPHTVSPSVPTQTKTSTANPDEKGSNTPSKQLSEINNVLHTYESLLA